MSVCLFSASLGNREAFRVRARKASRTRPPSSLGLKLGEVLAGNWMAEGYEENFRDELSPGSDEESGSEPGGLSDVSEQGGS